MVEGDIRDIERIPDIDILVVGFPYQSFSNTGQRRGVTDNKGNLFYEILRILEAKNPRAFLLENVSGLMSHDNGRTFGIITEALQQRGYSIKYEVLNPIEYGNVPHNKERIYMVAFKNSREYETFYFSKKIHLDKDISDYFDTKERKTDKYYCKNLKYYTMYYSKFKEFIIRQEMIYQFKTISSINKRILKEYTFCPVLTTYSALLINDGFDIRKLTPKEWFNFQGFYNVKIPTLIPKQIYINVRLDVLL